MKFKELDCVKLKKDIDVVPAGSIGTIVYVYEEGDEGYEVEFMDRSGNLIGLLTIDNPSYLEKVIKK